MLTLQVKNRNILGRKVRKKAFSELIPGIIYGAKIKSIPIFFNAKEFEKVFKEARESSLIQLEVGGKDKFLALIHDVCKHPLKDTVIHVDFYVPNPKKKVKSLVPLVLIGQAPAVKKGGILVKHIQEIIVRALPADVPHEIAVDVSKLENIGDEILVKDLAIPKGVELVREANDIVVSVLSPQKEEVVETTNQEEQKEPELVEKRAKASKKEESGEKSKK